jgi:hypothetical protein
VTSLPSPVKINLGEYVLIYCHDHRCSRHFEVNVDGWLDKVRSPFLATLYALGSVA